MDEQEEVKWRSLFLNTVRDYLTSETSAIPLGLIDAVSYDLADNLYDVYAKNTTKKLD